ncbi:hypothetical protein D3C71_1782250 [compost metagenome]
MPGCDIIGAKLQRLVQEFAELDLPVAHNVGIRRASRFVFIEKVSKHLVIVSFLKIYGIVRNINLLAYAADILGVGFRRAHTELVSVIPVLHKNPDHVIALLFQQERGNRGVDAPRHADDNTGVLYCFCHHGHLFMFQNMKYVIANVHWRNTRK